MHVQALIKLCLGWAIIGIFLLLLIAHFTRPLEINLADADAYLGRTVCVEGRLIDFVQKKNVAFGKLVEENVSLKFVYFGQVQLEEGQRLRLIGKIARYRGQLEIIAQEIWYV